MRNDAYEMIFKRKSFHLFRGVSGDHITLDELEGIEQAYQGFESLYPDIKTAIRIVPTSTVSFKWDAEYCILIYSEEKPGYMMNAGYLGEQLDLYLVSQNIGSLWYGLGKADEQIYQGMRYVIMIAVHKVNNPSLYRKDMFKAKRRPPEEIWWGDDLGIANIVRFAPSACNLQPWRVENEDGVLTVFRFKKLGRRGIMPAAAVSYFNRIDIGIFVCILEICLNHQGIAYDRTLFLDDKEAGELHKVAVYKIK